MQERSQDGRAVVLVQTAIGDYRQAFLDAVAEELGEGFRVFVGEEYFDPSTRTRVALDRLTSIRNYFLLGRRLLWQAGMWRSAFAADVLVLEFNPRIIPVWALLLGRRLTGRRSVLWGHAWPRSGRAKWTTVLRRVMLCMADAALVYTHTQARELSEWRPSTQVYVAPNALYRRATMEPAERDGAAHIIYVGRLVPEKKPNLLLQAFLVASDRLPKQTKLVFVGDGPLRSSMEAQAREGALGDRVIFTGHVAELAALRDLYADAVVSVSPGYAGLALTQSLSFGVPMIIARDEPHAPEIEAAIEDFNSIFVPSDSPGALADALARVVSHADLWRGRRRQIAQHCANTYSAETMAQGFLDAVRGQ